MPCGRLAGALAAGVWSVVVAAGQTPQPAMPAEVRARVQNERFQAVTSLSGLPLGVRDELQTLFGGLMLDIVDPGARFQAGRPATDARLSSRRLAAAGCSYEYCLVYYERGGGPRTWRVALFHWTPRATRLQWGGNAPGGLTTIAEVRQRILSGALPGGSPEPW